MRSFIASPIFFLWIAVACVALPQKDIAEDVAAKHNVRPHAPAGNLPPGCRIEYETKYGIEEIESTRQECRDWTENVCTPRQRPKCTPWTDRQCETKYRQTCRNWTEKKCTDTWRNECSQQSKEECFESKRPIQVPYEEDECTSKKERRCEKHWEERVKGKKVWVDNPATCRYYDTTECKPVKKYRTEQEKYTDCQQVPYQHCDRVKDTTCQDVPRQECKDEPYQDCRNVQRQRCVQETWQDCQDYPRRECKDVHQKIPKQVSTQVPIRVCGQGNHDTYNDGKPRPDFDYDNNGHPPRVDFGYDNNGPARPDFDDDGTTLFDIRTDNINPGYDVEEIDFEPDRERVDPGLIQHQTQLGTNPKKALDDDEVLFVFGDK